MYGNRFWLVVGVVMISSFLLTCNREELVYNKPALQMTLDKTKVNADGYTQVKITLKMLTDNVDTVNRKVLLQTDAGTFVSDTAPASKINLFLSSTKDSSVYLLVGKKPGIFPVNAYVSKLPQYYVSQQLELDTLTATSLLHFDSISSTSAKANNKDVITGKLVLKNTKNTTITLSTTDNGGAFDVSNTSTWSPQIPADGIIRFRLKAGSVPGDYYISAKLNDDRNFAVSTKYTLIALAAADVLEFTIPNATYLADSVTIINGSVKIKDTNQTSVSLVTSSGIFLPDNSPTSTVTVDPSGTKSFQLRLSNKIPNGNTSVLYSLKATSGNYSISNDITVYPANPDTLYINPSLFAIDKTNGSIGIKVKLARHLGAVSDGIQIAFRAYQTTPSGQQDVGRFKNTIPAFTQYQSVAVTYSTDTRYPDPTLPIHIEVSFKNDAGITKSGKIDLTVNP